MQRGKISFVLLVLLAASILGGLIGNVNANPGYLTIENNLNFHADTVNIVRNDAIFLEASDEHDAHDGENLSQPVGYPDIYTDIGTHDLGSDYRPEDSNIPYNIKLSFSGSLPSTQSNWLDFDFYNGHLGDYEFNGQPILFQSDRMPYGSVVDINRARSHSVDPNEVRIDLIDAPAGTSGEYGIGQLDIGTRLLSDLDDGGKVDFGDFATFAEDWQKGIGQYNGDIAGPNGIPDGYVNNHDLSAFCEDYLKDVNDPNTW